MRKTLSAATLAVALVLSAAAPHGAMAADKPSKATAQVKSDLYLTAIEAYEMLESNPKAVLIDVRDPIEIMFTGHTQETDFFVPYKFHDMEAWNDKKSVFMMRVNETFADDVEAELKAMGADKDSPLIFICRSGSTRSAPAADLLYERGWMKAYTVVDGFEGGKLGDGKSKGVRAKNGWRNAGLPWTYKMDKEKMMKAVGYTK